MEMEMEMKHHYYNPAAYHFISGWHSLNPNPSFIPLYPIQPQMPYPPYQYSTVCPNFWDPAGPAAIRVPSSKSPTVKGQWTPEEDRMLIELVRLHGMKKWSIIANALNGRIGKQCRERWLNHLRPQIKRDGWSEEEEKILIAAHAKMGNRWSEMTKWLTGRTENAIKNHWNATKRRACISRRRFIPRKSHKNRSSLLHDYIKGLDNDTINAGCRKKTEPDPDVVRLDELEIPVFDDDDSSVDALFQENDYIHGNAGHARTPTSACW